MGRERRITELLLGYWNIIKGSRDFPSAEDVHGEDLSDVWDNCFILRIFDTANISDCEYMYLGTALEQAYGNILTTDDTPPLVSPFAERLAKKYQEVITTSSPVMEEDAFVNAEGRTIRYRQILLPLGPDDNNISHILGGMRYKIYDS